MIIFSSFRIPTSSPLGDHSSTAALLGLHSGHRAHELPPNHPLSPTYLALHSSPTSSLRLPSHAEYLTAAATAQRLGELQQQAAQASLDVPFSLDGKSNTLEFNSSKILIQTMDGKKYLTSNHILQEHTKLWPPFSVKQNMNPICFNINPFNRFIPLSFQLIWIFMII